MTTVTNTIEKLKAALTILALDINLEEYGIDKAINEAIDTLTLLNKPPQVYIPHLNEFIVDKQFFIWEEGERFDCSFAMAMTNWTKIYAQVILDELVFLKSLHHRAIGSTDENDALLNEAAELVLSKFEYIETNTVV